MDILRKELNEIYRSQHLNVELLSHATLAETIAEAGTLVNINGACAVITDASCDRCYIYAGGFGSLMGLTDSECLYKEADSSDEDEIYLRMHPEDLVEKRMLEYEFFKMADSLPAEDKKSYKATCRIRMKDRSGAYRLIENSTQVIGLSPAGKIWLILCCYDLSTATTAADGISPCIVNNNTGDILHLSFNEGRQQLLTPREKEILRLVQTGKASKQIAAQLGISVNTVNRHRQNIIEKLSVGNSIEAVSAATAMKLL